MKPGERFHEAQQRARGRLRDLSLSERDPAAWEIVAEHLLEEDDPKAASVAYHLGASAAGSLLDFEAGQRLARLSDTVVCDFTKDRDRPGQRLTHALKTWPEPYEAMVRGDKTFEIRVDDRGFAVNDLLQLREWNPGTEEYTGRQLIFRVPYLVRGPEWGLPENMVVMALAPPMTIDQLVELTERVTGEGFIETSVPRSEILQVAAILAAGKEKPPPTQFEPAGFDQTSRHIDVPFEVTNKPILGEGDDGGTTT